MFFLILLYENNSLDDTTLKLGLRVKLHKMSNASVTNFNPYDVMYFFNNLKFFLTVQKGV